MYTETENEPHKTLADKMKLNNRLYELKINVRFCIAHSPFAEPICRKFRLSCYNAQTGEQKSH